VLLLKGSSRSTQVEKENKMKKVKRANTKRESELAERAMKQLLVIMRCDYCWQFLEKMIANCPQRSECMKMLQTKEEPDLALISGHLCIWNKKNTTQDLFALCDYCTLKDTRGPKHWPQIVTLKPYYDVMYEYATEKINDDNYEPPEWLIEALADTLDGIPHH
jgi:hypothetical protein